MYTRQIKSLNPVNTAILFFVVTIIVAHLFAPAEYDWQLNTISDLAAQQYENAWLMRMGFIGFGGLLSAAVLWRSIHARQKNHSDLLIVVYALTVLLSGVFSAAPFVGTSAYSICEESWHTLFAQTAGIAFCLAILWHLLVYARPNQRMINFIFFILVIGLSALVGLSKHELIPLGMGLIQRALYLVSFIWLIYRYR